MKRIGILVTVSAIILLSFVGCDLLKQSLVINQQSSSEVNDLNAVNENNPAYVAVVLIDDETQALFDQLGNTFSPLISISRLPRLEFKGFYKGANEFYTTMENILYILENHSGVIEKFRKVLKLANQIRARDDRYDFKVVFKGNARTKILDFFGLSESDVGDQVVALDYRDLMIVRVIAGALVKAYDGREEIREIINAARNAESVADEEVEGLISDEASSLISNFIDNHQYANPESSNFWYDLKDLVYDLAELKSNYNILDLKDIFKENALVIPGFGPEIDFANIALDSVLEIDAFERTKTNDKGWTEWYSLYELGIITNNVTEAEDIYLVKEVLDQNLNLWEDITTVKLNDLTIVNGVTTLREVLKKISDSLPGGTLTLKVAREFTEAESGLDDGIITSECTLDFSKLSSDRIDLKENNVGIDKSFAQIFIDQQIWNWNSWDYNTKKEKIKLILSTFFEKQTLITKEEDSFCFALNIGDGILNMKLTVTFSNLTTDQLIDSFIDSILTENTASISSILHKVKSLMKDALILSF